ncbi:MAG: HAMP domain-containing histidine kinase [Bacteroidetes bacterium]|nr:HAMP domain-containing histidine kinase [Bacteroidota bacterium]
MRLTLRARIFIAMFMLVVLGFGATGVVSFLHFKAEEVEYRRERLKRKEQAVEAHVAHELQRAIGKDIDEGDLMRVLNEELCSISQIHQIDVALYTMGGELLLSSNMALLDQGVLPPRLPELVHSRRNQVLSISDPNNLESEMLLYTAEIDDEMGLPIALMVVPYNGKLDRPFEDMAFYRALAWLHLVLFVAATYFAYLLSRSITQGLEVVGNAMKGNPEDGSSNPRPVAWRSKDEIGQLVESYNRMVHQTEENAKMLANAEKEQAWREMAQQVAHEIKNPLTPMRLMTQLHASRAGQLTAEEVKGFAEAMLAQIDAMAAVAGDFSELAKISSGVLRPVDLGQVLRRIQLAYPGLDLALPAGEWMVKGTEDSLLRVFNNLLNNALDAVEPGMPPALSVSVRDDEGSVLVSVRDNGTGIEPSRWEAIFEPHFTTKSTGSGLGLAMVKSIVEGMGGRIWIEASSAQGTEIILWVPRA